MSADEKESVIMRCLEGGVAFYIVKPVNPDDLKNVWQYAVASKKGKSIAIENIGRSSSNITSSVLHHFGKSSKTPRSAYHDFGDINYNGIKEKENNNIKKVDSNKKIGTKKGKDDGEEATRSRRQPPAPRKAKVIWTNSLHACFLMAISRLGLDSKQIVISN